VPPIPSHNSENNRLSQRVAHPSNGTSSSRTAAIMLPITWRRPGPIGPGAPRRGIPIVGYYAPIAPRVITNFLGHRTGRERRPRRMG